MCHANGWMRLIMSACAGAVLMMSALSGYGQTGVGALRVSIMPPEAVRGGAQWRRVGTTAWLDSGTSETAVPTGDYQVEFRNCGKGWAPPKPVPVTINNALTAEAVGTYGPSRADLCWSSYIGGHDTRYGAYSLVDDDFGYGVAADAAGNCYVTGYTSAAGWMDVGYDTTFNGTADAFVVKLTPDGQRAWATYLGGSGGDYGQAITLDIDGNIIVCGGTASAGWLTGGYDTNFHGTYTRYNDAFVIKLAPTGEPRWGSYLGGAYDDYGLGVAVDAAGAIFVAGRTMSSGWVRGGYDTTFNPSGGMYNNSNAFVVMLSATGEHIWSTYLGGGSSGGNDEATGVAPDGAGGVFVTGTTCASNWVAGGIDTSLNEGRDAFVARLSAEGDHLWSTYLGGNGWWDSGAAVAVDAGGCVYVAGTTVSSDWLPGSITSQVNSPTENGFIVKLTAWGQPVWSMSFGGDKSDQCHALALDAAGNVYAAGLTLSSGWVEGDIQDNLNNGDPSGDSDAFVIKLNSAGRALWSAYVGGRWNVVEFKPAGNWVTPANLIVAVNQGSLAETTATYAPGGALRVDISPPEAVTAGARWRRSGTTVWRDSGTTEAGVPAGPQQIEFAAVTGWLAPDLQSVTITAFKSTVASARYMRPTEGALSVTIAPPEAVAAGGRWRRLGTSAWLESGAQEVGLTPGACTVEFKPVAMDWIAPTTQSVTIQASQTARLTATYARTECDLLWSTYLGGADFDWGYGMAVDQQGNILVAGLLSTDGWASNNFERVYQQGVSNVACVVKLTPDGQPIWSAHLGGGANITAAAIALDAADNAYITGSMADGSWVSGGYSTTYHGGPTDAYVAKLSPAGRHLWSACLGGAQGDTGEGICLDPQGNVCVTGSSYETNSAAGWVSGGYDLTPNGAQDAFVVQLSSDGQHRWSSYLGGVNDEYGRGVATDGAGNVFVCGETNSGGWVSKGYDTTLGDGAGSIDGFVAKLSPTGGHLWSTYLGNNDTQSCSAIAVDAAGDAFVTGGSGSSAWLGDGSNLSDCVFAVRLTASGQFAWGSAPGGGGGKGIVLDGAGNAYITGTTTSAGWLKKGFNTRLGGYYNAFVTKLSALSGRQLWGAYLGGKMIERGAGITADQTGNVYVTGNSWSSNWISGGFDTTPSAKGDAFVAKIHDNRLSGTDWGALQVTITPAEAVAAGAQWRRVGTTRWRASGEIERELQPGPCQIEFGFCLTWAEPPRTTVTINEGQTTSLTAVYRRQLGSLRVTLAPPEVVAAGAQWRRTGTTSWWNSGATETGIIAGPYGLEYKPVPGWTSPTAYGFSITDGQVTGITGSYTRQTGSLQLTLAPAEAVAAGARWRRKGTTLWRESGVPESAIPTGPCTVEFKPLAGWNTPPDLALTIQNNQVEMASATWQRPPAGSLRVTLTPPAVVAAGAKWRRVGTTLWRDSGTSESGVAVGTHTVECLAVTGWASPQAQAVSVAQGQVTQASLAYVPQLTVTLTTLPTVTVRPGDRVTLGVTVTGASPVALQWKKNGVAFSGKTSPDLAINSCQVSDEGIYTCAASNPYLSAESTPVQVVVHESSPVLAYLLGLTTNKTGLDVTGDGRVEASDLIKAIRSLAPTVPAGPVPANAAKGVKVQPLLDWGDCRHTRTYDLYVWRASAARPAQPTAAGLGVSQWLLTAPLARRTDYQWQVVAHGDGGSVSGPVWSFTTE